MVSGEGDAADLECAEGESAGERGQRLGPLAPILEVAGCGEAVGTGSDAVRVLLGEDVPLMAGGRRQAGEVDGDQAVQDVGEERWQHRLAVHAAFRARQPPLYPPGLRSCTPASSSSVRTAQ